MRAGPGWNLRDGVVAVGFVVGLLFILIELTGPAIDEQISETTMTAVAVLVFTVLGSVGVALARFQPRFALFGTTSTMLAVLAFGATVASLWRNGPFLFGFTFQGTSGTVGGVTVILSLAASATCVLLATVRHDEDSATRLVRVLSIGSLALFVGMAILSLIDHSVDISSQVYAIAATVYVIATVILIAFRLLPVAGDPIGADAPEGP